MAFYTILLAQSGYDIVALKATTTPTTGTNWSEQDGSVRIETGGGRVISMWAVEGSSDIHIATQQEDGRVRYHVFDPGTDTWTTKNEYVANAGDTNFEFKPSDPAVSLAVRSDGDVVLVAAYRNLSQRLRLFVKTTSWSNVGLASGSEDDISTWTSRTEASANSWSSVTFANGLFVAVANSGKVMTSPNGVDWTSRTEAAANFWNSVTFGDGLFVAVSGSGTNRVMTSPNGIDWTSQSAASASTWSSVTFANGLFVAVSSFGPDRVMTSPNGIDWTSRTEAAANSWNSVTFGDGLFVAISGDGTNRVMTSPNGIDWTSRSAAQANQWVAVTFGDGLFVAVSLGGTDQVMTSPDGINWTSQSAAQANIWESVTFGDGLFVAVSNDGTDRVMTSPNGIDWTVQSAAQANTWESVTFGDGLFVAVSLGGTDQVMTSLGPIDYTGVSVVGPDSSDRITWAYNDRENNDVDIRSVDSGTTISAITEVDGAVDVARFTVGPGAIDSANKIYMPYIDATDKISVGNWTSGATPSISVSADVGDNTVEGNSKINVSEALPFILACLAVKGTDVHLLYADDATQDIFHDDDVDGGGTTDVERNDAVTANRLSCNHLAGSDVLAWLYLDGTNTVYDELSLTVVAGSVLQAWVRGPIGHLIRR